MIIGLKSPSRNHELDVMLVSGAVTANFHYKTSVYYRKTIAEKNGDRCLEA